MRRLEDNTLLLVLVVVSLLLGWIIWPFSGALLWAVVFAVTAVSLDGQARARPLDPGVLHEIPREGRGRVR